VGYNNYRYFVNFLIWVTLGTVYIALVCTPRLLSSGLLAFPSPFSLSMPSFPTTLLKPINIYVDMFRNVSSRHITSLRGTRKLFSSNMFFRNGTEIPLSGTTYSSSHLFDSVSYYSLPVHVMGNYYPLPHMSRVLSSVWGGGSVSDSSSHSKGGFASAWIGGCDAFLRATHLKENLPDETLLLFFVAVICIGKYGSLLMYVCTVCTYTCMTLLFEVDHFLYEVYVCMYGVYIVHFHVTVT
jgi:hypothetical protein